MKREMIEKAVNELDLEIIEKNLDASGIRRRNLLKRATILAAAAAVLITAGIFVKNNMITKDPSGTEKQTGNETEQGAKIRGKPSRAQITALPLRSIRRSRI